MPRATPTSSAGWRTMRRCAPPASRGERSSPPSERVMARCAASLTSACPSGCPTTARSGCRRIGTSAASPPPASALTASESPASSCGRTYPTWWSMRRCAGGRVKPSPSPPPQPQPYPLRRCARVSSGQGLGWSRRAQAPAPKTTPQHAAHQHAAHQHAPRAGRGGSEPDGGLRSTRPTSSRGRAASPVPLSTPCHPATLPPSHPPTVAPCHPPTLAPSHPRTVGAPGAADQLWLEVTTSNRVGMGAQACRVLASLYSQACTPRLLAGLGWDRNAVVGPQRREASQAPLSRLSFLLRTHCPYPQSSALTARTHSPYSLRGGAGGGRSPPMCRPAILACPTARQRCDACSLLPTPVQPDFYRALGYDEVSAQPPAAVQRASGIHAR